MIATLICGRISSSPKEQESSTGQLVVRCSVKAMIGRESSEAWQIVAHNPPVRETLMALGVHSHVALTGVPKTEIIARQGQTLIWRTLFAERALSLLPQEEELGDE